MGNVYSESLDKSSVDLIDEENESLFGTEYEDINEWANSIKALGTDFLDRHDKIIAPTKLRSLEIGDVTRVDAEYEYGYFDIDYSVGSIYSTPVPRD